MDDRGHPGVAVHDSVRLLHALRAAHRDLNHDRGALVDTTLQQIVRCAVQTVEPAVGGGITRTAEGTVHSAFPTDADIETLDQLQSDLGEGPCVTAAGNPPSDGVVLARDLSASDLDRWPSFAPQAAALGYRSLLSLQLSATPGRRSALNLYAREPDAFDEAAVVTATLFSLQAATRLHGADEAENLRRALETRDLLGQAKGVLSERFRLSDDDAFAMLVAASQNANIKLVDIARGVLDDARRDRSGPIARLST